MDDSQVRHAMSLDDAYLVERVLARGPRGTTELVTLDGAGPFVRKRMPHMTVHRLVWAALAECQASQLPQVRATYDLPDAFVAVCEYVPGETLAHRMVAAGRLELKEVAGIVADLCAAVSELHAHQIIHADIVPANVVLAEDGAHLIDFGCARMIFDAVRDGDGTWGTRGFAAPEQYGFAPVDTRADLYGIGRLAGYLLTGLHLDERTYEASLRCSGLVPEGVCQVLGRACAFEPSARYQTADELSRAFAAAARGDDSDAGGHDVVVADGGALGDHDAFVASAEERDGASSKDAFLSPEGSSTAQGSRRPRRRTVIALAAALLIVLIAVLIVAPHVLNSSGSGTSARSSAASTGGADVAADATADGSDTAGIDSAAVSAASGDARSDSAINDLVEEAATGLQLTETTWYTDEAGYVHYAVVVANTADDVTALYPTVRITGRDAAGNVVLSDDQVLSTLYPGGTRYWGGISGNGTAPETVEFSIAQPGLWEVERTTGAATEFSVSGVSTSIDAVGDFVVTGEVELVSRGDEELTSQVQVVAIGRDAQGVLVWGESTYVSEPAEGEKVPFEVAVSSDSLPAFDTVEVFAYLW